MIKELKALCDECRSNSCIEHATGIIEELKGPENLSKKISAISLTPTDKKVLCSFIFSICNPSAFFFPFAYGLGFVWGPAGSFSNF